MESRRGTNAAGSLSSRSSHASTTKVAASSVTGRVPALAGPGVASPVSRTFAAMWFAGHSSRISNAFSVGRMRRGRLRGNSGPECHRTGHQTRRQSTVSTTGVSQATQHNGHNENYTHSHGDRPYAHRDRLITLVTSNVMLMYN